MPVHHVHHVQHPDVSRSITRIVLLGVTNIPTGPGLPAVFAYIVATRDKAVQSVGGRTGLAFGRGQH